MKKILLIGGGGHCCSVIDTIKENNDYPQIAIVDNKNLDSVNGVPVIGTDSDLEKLFNDGWTEAFITVGSVGDVSARRNIYVQLKKIGFSIPSIIDKSALISATADIEEGVFIGKRTVVNFNSVIEKCAIINTGAIVEHDCKIGEFSHISCNATLCGNVSVGKNTHIGASTVVKQQIKVGEDTIIGTGSNVVKNVPDNSLAYGNPCEVIKCL